MSRVVVIGAGVGGLAAAARLATAGHAVTLVERSAGAGGKLAGYTRHTPAGAFRFDTGPSLLTLPQVATELLTATGGDPATDLDLVRLDPVVRHRFPDGSVLDSCDDHAAFTGRIAEAFGAPAADDWRRLWRRAARVWAVSWRSVLTAPVDSPLAVARLAWRLPDLAAIAPWRTLRQVGAGQLRDPRLRMLLDRYATYTGADPRRAPAALLAVPYAELHHGGWYLRGGLTTLADALLARCADRGVRLRFDNEVTSIRVAGGRVAGVGLAGGGTIAADVVVANADALQVYRDLLPTPRLAARLSDRSLAGFVLLLGVRGATAGLAHHTVLFPGDYDAEFDAVFGVPRRGLPARPADDPAIFITVARDDTVHPAGHEAWFVLVNAPPHGRPPTGVDWRAAGVAERYADRIMDLMAARGVDCRQRLVFREIRTPADLADATASPGGSIYGTASHGLLRPASRGPVPGLFLVGGSVHPGGGLPLVMLSARLVADRIGTA